MNCKTSSNYYKVNLLTYKQRKQGKWDAILHKIHV